MCVGVAYGRILAFSLKHISTSYACRPCYCHVPVCTTHRPVRVHDGTVMYPYRAMRGTRWGPTHAPTEFYAVNIDTCWYTEISGYIPRISRYTNWGIPRNLGIPISVPTCTGHSFTQFVSIQWFRV